MSLFSRKKSKNMMSGRLDLLRPVPISSIFPDAQLAQCVAAQLEKYTEIHGVDDGVTMKELMRIRNLPASEAGIQDIRGLEYLLGLKDIDLSGNQIEKIPFTFEDVETVNRQYQCYFSLNQMLLHQVIDLSHNRLTSMPEYIRQCRRKEANMFIDLSGNLFEDNDVFIPTAEAVADYIQKTKGTAFTDTQIFWLVYAVHAWYLVTKGNGLTAVYTSDAYGFEKQNVCFEKVDSMIICPTVWRQDSITSHAEALRAEFGREPFMLRRDDVAPIKKVIDYWADNHLIPEGMDEPFQLAASGDVLEDTQIADYYQNHMEAFGHVQHIQPVGNAWKEKEETARKNQLKQAFRMLERAEDATNSPEVHEKLERIRQLINQISDYIGKHPGEFYFDFELNYLPMLTNILKSYVQLPTTLSDTMMEAQRKRIENAFDSVITAFSNYQKNFNLQQSMEVYSEVDALEAMFKKNGLL